MATRIPVSWLLLLIVVAVFAFFGYHIIQASTQNEESPALNRLQMPSGLNFANPTIGHVDNSSTLRTGQQALYHNTNQAPPPEYLRNVPSASDDSEPQHAVSQKQPQVALSMPHVSGQTEEDLRAPEPLQATPPSIQYDVPEATDPLNKNVYMPSEFGSNFRHPEQMMERHPGIGMGNVVAAQIGSERSGPGGNNVAGYAPEMAQNGGEFMNGISAFDTSESGVAYSMI